MVCTADYGDRSHTMQALRIYGDFEEVRIRESRYSESGFAIETLGDYDCNKTMQDSEDPEWSAQPKAVVLR